MKERCRIFHDHAGVYCSREKGHDGLCWSRSIRNPDTGSITRCEWYSENGKFKRHHQYDMKYPSNARKEPHA